MIYSVSSNSAVALTILKATQDQTGANTKATNASTSDVATHKSTTVSGNTIFAILGAAAASARSIKSGQADEGYSASGASVGSKNLFDDPFLKKDYSSGQALNNWMASINVIGGAAAFAQAEGWSGDRAAGFIKAFDGGTLKVADPNSIIGMNYSDTKTYSHSLGSVVDGKSESISYNDAALESYLTQNPNTLLSGDFGNHSWGGLLISW